MKMTEIIGTPMPYSTQNVPQRMEAPVKESQKAVNDSKEDNIQKSSQLQTPTADVHQRRDTRITEVSLTFNKEESFDYIGSESSLANLDVQKAISVMKKDKILQEYQYFVGGKPDLEYDGDIDGAVFQK